jgi:hypothetical protein
LVNELLGTRLGLPTTPMAIIEVREELIRLTPDLSMELPRSRIPCQPGLQFGSLYPGDPRAPTVHDFLPDEQLRQVQNVHDFAGMLVFVLRSFAARELRGRGVCLRALPRWTRQ